MTTPPEPSIAATYAGYRLVAQLDQAREDDGSSRYSCQLTASEISDRPDPLVFTRTLILGEAQAALMNARQPGTVPPLDRLHADLVKHGVRYMEALINAVNRGFRTIAPEGRRSVSDVRSFVGMTDTALQNREG
ncbi:MAG TPA: hypothetical protein VKV26_19690 [Dehalococcoidia bacterium]|nr:hypothetical protein [Dehalococcoidia bacterium]